MGGSSSKADEQFASASSKSVVYSDGTGELFHSTYTGSNKDGSFTGQGLSFHQLIPQVATSFVFDFLAIMTIALFIITMTKYFRQQRVTHKVQRRGNVIMVEMKEMDKIEPV